MKYLYPFTFLILLSGCDSDIEEIKDPATGTLLKRYEYYTDENGQKVKHGQYTEWNEDGSLQWQCEYQDGKKEGNETVYLSIDSIAYNTYRNDSLDGSCRVEYKGTIIRKLSYSKGKLNGEQQYYYEDGTLRTRGGMKNGFSSGTWRCYNEDGKVCATFTFTGVPCYIKELQGRWDRQTDSGREAYYIFDSLATAAYYSPLFKYDKKAAPFPQYEGFVFLNEQLVISMGDGLVKYDVILFDGNTLKLRNRFDDIETYKKTSRINSKKGVSM